MFSFNIAAALEDTMWSRGNISEHLQNMKQVHREFLDI